MAVETTDEAWFLLLRRATNWIFEHTVGIYFQMAGGDPVPWGSGVLLRIADASFVLSASHVLKRASEATLRLAPSVEGSRFVTISSLDLQRSKDTEHLDIGWMRLSEDDSQKLAIHKRFLRMSHLDTEQRMSEGAYVVAGYPVELTKVDKNEITANRFSYLTNLAPVENEIPGVTLGLSFKSSILRHEDGTDTARMPSLGGISGCGIWRVWADSQGNPIGRWDTSWIRLAGIEHAVTSRRSIRGTIIGHMLGMIARSYPELLPSIRVSLR